MSNPTRFDLTREEIIERYRQRIARGDRTWAIGAIVTVTAVLQHRVTG